MQHSFSYFLLIFLFITPCTWAASISGDSSTAVSRAGGGAGASASGVVPKDDKLEAIRIKHRVPALAVAIVRPDVTVVRVSGIRKSGDATLVTEADKFHLGSCTKAMTATVLATFIERGLLRWDSKLKDLFPEWGSMHPHFKEVTVEMLTSHRAGIDDNKLKAYRPDIERRTWNNTWEHPAEYPSELRRKCLPAYLAIEPAYTPGREYRYSNTGYIIVGAILEKIGRKSWEVLIKEILFEPLGMHSAGFNVQASPEKPWGGVFNILGIRTPPDQPWPHKADGTPEHMDNPPFLGPAGTVHCSLEDWGKFIRLHMDGYNGRRTPILRPDSFRMLHSSPPGQEYTYGGWIKTSRSWTGGVAFTHEGSNTLNYAIVWIAPTRNTAYVSATNIANKAAADEAIDLLIVKSTMPSSAACIAM